MIEDVGSTLPSVVATAFAMIAMSGLTLWVAKRSGVSDIQAVASRESDRLVKAQSGQIKILREDAARDKVRIEKLEESLRLAFIRIDKLERLVSNEQLKRLDREVD